MIAPPQLCKACEPKVVEWGSGIAEEMAKVQEEEEQTRLLYDTLACFVTGALTGVFLGLILD